MPPQNGPRKLSAQQQRTLIQKYNLSIEGPIRPRDWPKKYASLFGLVRDTEKVRYDEYYQADLGNDDQKLLQVAQMRSRVEKLVSQAYSLRESLDNEETWRLKTEHLILERFETDVDCHVCNKRRWLSDLQALPSCPIAAEKLQRIRAGRSPCRCGEVVRAKLLAESCTQQPFVTKGSCTVVGKSIPEIQKRVLAHHRPDRVLGLGRTHELQGLVAANPDITATIIKDDTDTYFPFLVLEAKSEKNTVGFESIERQTAFPIRAMVNIQKALETASSVPLDPLVWFLANRGDEWRVYGCVPDRSRIRIIDLWHGCILRHDSALQLFLIIDLLCDWARDIFTEQVFCCLRQRAGPGFSTNSVEEVTFLQPSSSRDTQEVQLLSPNWSTPEHTHDISSGPEIIIKAEPADVVMDEVLDATHEDISNTETLSPPNTETPSPRPSTHELSGTSENEVNIQIPELSNVSDIWEHVAVKSDRDVRLQFRSISLPESPHELSLLIKALGAEDDLVQSARKLLALFNRGDPFIIQPEFVNRLQGAWGKPIEDQPSHDRHLLYTCLNWRASFDYVNWVLTKELSCITASMTAMAALATISKIPTTNVIPEGRVKPTIRETRLIHPLRYLPLAELVQAASRNQFLHLKVCGGIASPTGWIEDHEKDVFSKHFWHVLDSEPEAFLKCTENIRLNVEGSSHVLKPWDEIQIPHPLQVPEIDKGRQIALLKRPNYVEGTEQVYCIFTFDPLDAYRPFVIGSAVLSFFHEGCSCFHGNNEPLTEQDRKTLAQLSSILINLTRN